MATLPHVRTRRKRWMATPSRRTIHPILKTRRCSNRRTHESNTGQEHTKTQTPVTRSIRSIVSYSDGKLQREYQRNWIRKRRAAYFNGKSCAHCGSTSELELDHIDRTKKLSHNVWSWSAPRRAAELAKCQVLCSDCHLKKSLAERPKPKHGGGMYKHGCRCDKCVQWNRDRVNRQRGKLIA